MKYNTIFKKRSLAKNILLFIIGLGLGVSAPLIMEAGNNVEVDYENGTGDNFEKKIYLMLGGYAVYYILLSYTILFSIALLIPGIGKQIQQKAAWTRLLAGVSVGFGIMQFITLSSNGITFF